jgi:2-hydroxychromene-2-carboxylate isomerase
MSIRVVSYTIYHSPNAYLGTILAGRVLGELPVSIERRPIYVPKARGVLVADLVGGRESRVQSSYHREDCARWARKHGIPIQYIGHSEFLKRASRWAASSLDREELPARSYYAAVGSGREAELDRALFRAAWVGAQDVNEEVVVRDAARQAGLDPDQLIGRALQAETKEKLDAALAAFERDRCPGVPMWVLNGERFWGKDRVDWLAKRVRELISKDA